MDWLDLTQLIDGFLTLRAAAVLPELAKDFTPEALALLNAACPAGTTVDVCDLRAAIVQAEMESAVVLLTAKAGAGE